MKKEYKTYEEKLESSRQRARDVKEFEDKVRKELGYIEKKHESLKQQKFRENKKYQDIIIRNWKLTGMFIPPEEKEIKKIIEEEEKDEERQTYEDFDDININDMFDTENNEEDEGD